MFGTRLGHVFRSAQRVPGKAIITTITTPAFLLLAPVVGSNNSTSTSSTCPPSHNTTNYARTNWRGFASKKKSRKIPNVQVTKTTHSDGTTNKRTVAATVTDTNSNTNNNNGNDNDNETDKDKQAEQEIMEGFPDPVKEGEIQKLQYEVRMHHSHGQYLPALESAKRLLQMTEVHFGTDHPATATAFNNIGLMHKLLGEFSASRKMYHDALRVYGRVVGKDHASYAAALHNLGNLNRSQVYLDETITAMERLQLNEVAVEYLEEAWQIRKVELGDEHPHTVASRSSLGSTIATQVLQQVAKQSKQSKGQPSSRLTKRRWEAAEEHLRASLDIAIKNPRGDEIKQQGGKHHKNNKKVTTLSAASAAQNLAVFLKSRATSTTTSDAKQKEHSNDDSLAEAKRLYESALQVRKKLLDDAHPDLVSSKYSLAELLSTLGDEEGANVLRNQIVNSYDVEEATDEQDEPNK